MLWILFMVLGSLWLLGIFGKYPLGIGIHVLLILAVVALAVQLFRSGHRPV
jgi:hypothetical protein